MILARFLTYLTLTTLFGLASFALYALPKDERHRVFALRRWLLGSTLTTLILSPVSLALMAAQMGGAAAWPVDWETVELLLGNTAAGTAWMLRVAALLIAALALGFSGLRVLTLVAACAFAALASLAWNGHGAMDDGAVGWLHLAADILHLAASAIWIGAVLGLLLMVVRPPAQTDTAHLTITHAALKGFGPIGTIVVGTLVATGLLNLWRIVGLHALGSLPTTLYGQLLLAKLALFAALLALASLNRFRLTPAFQRAIDRSDHRAALSALRTSLLTEASCAAAIFALVAWLGTLDPLASAA